MSIVDTELDRLVKETDEGQHRALIKLARELEAHCDSMAQALHWWERHADMIDESQALAKWREFKKERG